MFQIATRTFSRQTLSTGGGSPIPSRTSKLSPATLLEGDIVCRSGTYSQGGTKHDECEDRIFTRMWEETSTLNELILLQDALKELSSKGAQIDFSNVFLSVVCDGHGGSKTAEFVSKNLLTSIISQHKHHLHQEFHELQSSVLDGFKNCEDLLANKLPSETSGCCALATIVYQNELIVAHIGDVRAILCEGERVRQLTIDHRTTDANERSRILENGGEIVNQRISGVLSPTRAFGNVDLHLILPENVLIAEPVVSHFVLNEDKIRTAKASYSFVIVASDGVWDCMSNEHACDVVSRSLKSTGGNAQAAAKKLGEEASRKNLDDVTVNVLVFDIDCDVEEEKM